MNASVNPALYPTLPITTPSYQMEMFRLDHYAAAGERGICRMPDCCFTAVDDKGKSKKKYALGLRIQRRRGKGPSEEPARYADTKKALMWALDKFGQQFGMDFVTKGYLTDVLKDIERHMFPQLPDIIYGAEDKERFMAMHLGNALMLRVNHTDPEGHLNGKGGFKVDFTVRGRKFFGAVHHPGIVATDHVSPETVEAAINDRLSEQWPMLFEPKVKYAEVVGIYEASRRFG